MTLTLLGAFIDESKNLLICAGALSLLSLIAAIVMSVKLKGWSPGNEEMQRLAAAIRKGAMAFLRTEYIILFFFVLGLGALSGCAEQRLVEQSGHDNLHLVRRNSRE